MTDSRRRFLAKGVLAAAAGSFPALSFSGCQRSAHRPREAALRRLPSSGAIGFGALQDDPKGMLKLPSGFSYKILSQEGDPLSDASLHGQVPSSHDGMGAFWGDGGRSFLVRNHELTVSDIQERGKIAVRHLRDRVYDPQAVGGTTTLLVSPERELLHHKVSLAGTLDNCAGGITPWDTWLSCEENTDTLDKPHGYVFEVCPYLGGNPEPIVQMGRFRHEAVCFGAKGEAYLSEDATSPFGCMYRFLPARPHGGRSSLHAGGVLEAMRVEGIDPRADLSQVQRPGTRLSVAWVPISQVDPRDLAIPVREQGQLQGATPIPKCEGLWTDRQGRIWMTSSRAYGPDQEPSSTATHGGQIWRYDPATSHIELVVIMPENEAWDGPDNITVSPHGFTLVCSDGRDDQWIAAVGPNAQVSPFAFNAADQAEFAGATFSADGRTLFVNVQGDRKHGSGPKGRTFAIWGPWDAFR